MKAAIYTLGCKVNQYESEVMTEQLIKNGYEIVAPSEYADVYIVNSCTVTAESDRKTRQTVRRLKRQNPLSVLVLTGCIPQAYPDIASILPEADILLGNKNNNILIPSLESYFRDKSRLLLTSQHQSGDIFCPSVICGFNGKTRANVKIEDGCNRFCSYCIIPYARGRVRSKSIENLKKEVSLLEAAGFSEIVLVGINLSAYNDNGNDLCDAVEAASSFENIKRVRLGSLEPDHITDEMIKRLAKCKKLCPQFHISLQSGCDKTLRAMNRHYTASEYEALCQRLRSCFDDATLTTDVMVGFAGETDEDFSESVEFVKRIAFEKVHVFPYSVRKGTRAASFDNQIPKSVKEERSKKMIEISSEIRQRFLASQKGRILEVLIEENSGGNFREGYTMNYTPVKIIGACPEGGFVKVKIEDADEEYCVGTVV